jgi:leucyl/phenylalanyl-tRNA--protein transferase
MPVEDGIGWFSPDPRGVLPLGGLRVSRSLRRSLRRYTVTFNRDFEAVMRACGDPARPDGWINEQFIEAYCCLRSLGNAHSVEAWSATTGALAGGLYGVAIGGFFAGESMFSVERDASKVALVGLVDALVEGGGVLLDVQWVTPHLATLGAVEIPRARYLGLLADAVSLPQLGGPFAG